MTESKTDIEREEDQAAGRPRPAADIASQRKCMSCGEKFASEGWHNRLCQRCRRRSVAG